jgi:hypothetical protein
MVLIPRKESCPMNALPSFISGLTIGSARVFGRMTLYPLFHVQSAPLSYRTLDESVSSGSLRISEVSLEGQVPTLLLRNFADEPVLILDGEELVGAKQNRVLNLTVLVPGNAELTVPVTCVEQGRWAYNTPAFRSSKRALYANLRARKVAQVSESLALTGSRSAHQTEIWRDLADKCHRMGVHSPTGAMTDLYDRFDSKLEEAIAVLQPSQGEAGAIVAINGSIRGLDAFDRSGTYLKLFPKLLGSYAVDAFDQDLRIPAKDTNPRNLFDLLTSAQAEMSSHPAPGLGNDLRIRSSSIVGAALEVDHTVIHLCAFPTYCNVKQRLSA